MRNAVLFLVFNRADTTAQVFEAIRQARPPRLYVAADGARQGRPDEPAQCEATRLAATAVDWPCEVKTLFREQNLGCKMAVSGAIDWFFQHEEQGVILEDDCLPDPSFFDYCDTLLDKYKDDPRVMCISGDNFLNGQVPVEHAYYFSKFCHIWGWASWRRAWQGYDVAMRDWTPESGRQLLKQVFPRSGPMQRIWLEILSRVAKGEINTWDYQWVYRCWLAGGFTVLPAVNLISNIGFDDRATHTADAENKLANMRTQALPQPLAHPPTVARHEAADKWSGEHLFPVARYTLRRVLGRHLKVALGLRSEP